MGRQPVGSDGRAALTPSSIGGPSKVRWRVALHALDRTGPPMLARALIGWLAVHRPDVEVSVLAFRGGSMIEEFRALAPVRVVLRNEEAWDHRHPPVSRASDLRRDLADLGPADVNLLISVAAGQILPYVPGDFGPVTAWVVEQGEDLHWLRGPLRVVDAVDHWIAGSHGTAAVLTPLVGDVAIPVAYEFVDAPPGFDAGSSSSVSTSSSGREQDGGSDEEGGSDEARGRNQRLVLGAGIGTHRKAPDLFVEVALATERRAPGAARFVWIGGERDPLLPLLIEDVRKLGLSNVEFVSSMPQLASWFSAADLFVHTARLDAFPLVCMHAALAGTPVLAFAGVGGVEEMMGDTFCGVSFPDVAGLAQLVIDGDPVALGVAQRDHVAARFTTAVAAAALVAAVERANSSVA